MTIQTSLIDEYDHAGDAQERHQRLALQQSHRRSEIAYQLLQQYGRGPHLVNGNLVEVVRGPHGHMLRKYTHNRQPIEIGA